MGMTDMQFKAFLREIIDNLEQALETAKDKETRDELERMIKRYGEVLKD